MADGLSLERLVVRASGRVLVEEVSLSVRPGEVVALVGSSGSGKTLTCRAILGMVDLQPGVVAGDLAITAGGITVRPYRQCLGGGRRARDEAFAPIRGRMVGYLPQEAPSALDPHRRVGDQVTAAALLAGAALPPQAWLARAGFSAAEADRVTRAWPHELSGGMAQRVVIAQTLARGSRFVLADEPTTGLDAPIARRLAHELRLLADDGLGVLLVTHDLSMLPGVADRVSIMDGGRVIETLDAGELGRGQVRSEIGRALAEAAGGSRFPDRAETRRARPEGSAWALDGVRRVYRSLSSTHRALDGASLEVRAGERVAVIGPSGSGKSTLVRCGLGLDRRDGGSVGVLGEDATRWSAWRWRQARSRVQVLFQDPRAMLHPDLPIGVLLEESAALHRPGEDREGVARSLLEAVGLAERATALPRELSGGERRRAGIARVLACRPALLVADEPTAGLDAVLKPRMLRLLAEAAGPGCAVVIVTHDVAAVAHVAERMIVLHGGSVVESFPTDALRGGWAPAHPTTAELLAASGWGLA